jgi:hypothetical protein
MKITTQFKLAAAATIFALGTAHAATTTSLTGLVAGPLVNPGSFTATLNAPVADTNASLTFVIQGYNSLDGHNLYQDDFRLTINGSLIDVASFDLGGGGWSNNSFGGATVTVSSGTATISGLNFSLLQGVNTFKFQYTAPGPSNGANGQGLGDEGWGIASATVTAVPEPETYAMLLAGLGLMGAVARRRKQA